MLLGNAVQVELLDTQEPLDLLDCLGSEDLRVSQVKGAVKALQVKWESKVHVGQLVQLVQLEKRAKKDQVEHLGEMVCCFFKNSEYTNR